MRAENIANTTKAQNKGVNATNRMSLYESLGNAGAFVSNLKTANMTTSAKILTLNSMFPNFEINATNVDEFLAALENGESLIKFKATA